MGIEVNVTSNRDLIEQASAEAIARALEAIGLQAEGYAKDELSKPKPHSDGTTRPNVDTGRLRNSITHSYDSFEQKAYVGTNLSYAAYVEMGTSKSKAYPYLKPAIVNHIDEYKQMVEYFLKNG